MFQNHFNFISHPFSENIPVQSIIKDDRMSQGLAKLQYFTQSGIIALVSGQTGVGKSSLIKLFLAHLPQNQFHPIYLHFTNVRSSSLFSLIAYQFGEVPKNTKDRRFLQIIEKIKKNNLNPLLIIDEAHLLEPNALTDLRLLTSSALDDSPLIKIILMGQEDIHFKLQKLSHPDLVHRISVSFHLKPLSKSQTIAYIDFHLKNAGAHPAIFEPEVKESIHEFSNGIPRQINNICSACLLHAFSQNAQKITTEILTLSYNEINHIVGGY
jgi:general secretion pathway protein A